MALGNLSSIRKSPWAKCLTKRLACARPVSQVIWHYEVLPARRLAEGALVHKLSIFIWFPNRFFAKAIACLNTSRVPQVLLSNYPDSIVPQTPDYFSFGPAINILIPFPPFTSLKACSASSNLTVPVISFFTFTLPVATSSTASL